MNGIEVKINGSEVESILTQLGTFPHDKVENLIQFFRSKKVEAQDRKKKEEEEALLGDDGKIKPIPGKEKE